jgi:serine/threonine protein kinase
MQEQSIFIEALDKDDPAERAAFLDRVCAGDPALRQRIERLLHRHQQADNFLASPAVAPAATVDEPLTERPGTRIGPYKLLQEIGEGGMGVVYLAEQEQPVRRKVALKILKPGLDSRQVSARFEAERQALALMDHPNIARVLDAGATESGRPYFVMELVHGMPITQYCDGSKLTPRERLELFLPVWHAIQHAHQKGIIHRDLKPSNILVTMYDDKPVPKVIDFGVAKAVEQRLTDKTLFTQFGTLVGTFEYMSPEAAADGRAHACGSARRRRLGVGVWGSKGCSPGRPPGRMAARPPEGATRAEAAAGRALLRARAGPRGGGGRLNPWLRKPNKLVMESVPSRPRRRKEVPFEAA